MAGIGCFLAAMTLPSALPGQSCRDYARRVGAHLAATRLDSTVAVDYDHETGRSIIAPMTSSIVSDVQRTIRCSLRPVAAALSVSPEDLCSAMADKRGEASGACPPARVRQTWRGAAFERPRVERIVLIRRTMAPVSDEMWLEVRVLVRDARSGVDGRVAVTLFFLPALRNPIIHELRSSEIS